MDNSKKNIDQLGHHEVLPWVASPLGRFFDGMSALGSVWIAAVMFLVCADVVARSFFNHPIPAVAEMAGYAVVGIVFLQLPAAFLRNRMTRSDLVMHWLNRHVRWLGLVLQVLFGLFSVAIFALLAKVGWAATLVAIDKGEKAGVEGVFSFASWPLKALITGGSICSIIALLAMLLALFCRTNRFVAGDKN
ncbi:TRAP transporter small permease subunit [Pusillimonas sp. NJUB218]|uniref:TRAP transporter small permease subunit n=1 Tax=Pusillimonas sp. NJUB218 TaxID=2023230 RepID=UPI000F4CA6BF|nr:TRAP transporter small permease [Pusillimonas sp. NJUB218]ROT46588.1 hypothetical protein CHR62_01245 [Pusillimonas sp. NJUB218]